MNEQTDERTRVVPLLGTLQGEALAVYEHLEREDQAAEAEDAIDQLRQSLAALQADQVDLRRELEQLRAELRAELRASRGAP